MVGGYWGAGALGYFHLWRLLPDPREPPAPRRGPLRTIVRSPMSMVRRRERPCAGILLRCPPILFERPAQKIGDRPLLSRGETQASGRPRSAPRSVFFRGSLDGALFWNSATRRPSFSSCSRRQIRAPNPFRSLSDHVRLAQSVLDVWISPGILRGVFRAIFKATAVIFPRQITREPWALRFFFLRGPPQGISVDGKSVARRRRADFLNGDAPLA